MADLPPAAQKEAALMLLREELALRAECSHCCCYTLLLLVEYEYPGEVVTLAEVHTWTHAQVRGVIRWAAAVHLAASDNYPWMTGGHVPPMPTVLSER